MVNLYYNVSNYRDEHGRSFDVLVKQAKQDKELWLRAHSVHELGVSVIQFLGKISGPLLIGGIFFLSVKPALGAIMIPGGLFLVFYTSVIMKYQDYFNERDYRLNHQRHLKLLREQKWEDFIASVQRWKRLKLPLPSYVEDLRSIAYFNLALRQLNVISASNQKKTCFEHFKEYGRAIRAFQSPYVDQSLVDLIKMMKNKSTVLVKFWMDNQKAITDLSTLMQMVNKNFSVEAIPLS